VSIQLQINKSELRLFACETRSTRTLETERDEAKQDEDRQPSPVTFDTQSSTLTAAMPSSLPPPSAPPTTPLSTSSSIPSPTEEARLNNATPAPSYPRRIVAQHNGAPLQLALANRALSPKRQNETGSSLLRQTQQQAQECDYDVQPTDLYQAIEAKQWEYVARLFHGASSAVAKAKQEASTWVVRKESNGRLRWRLLPIHAALIFQAPCEVIEVLLQEYPEGASCKDDQGMLPLHLALRNTPSNFTIVEELLTVHPAAVYVKDRKGRTPLQGGLAAIKDAETRAGLTVLDMMTQIATAGEKQRWLAEQKQAADQRLAATQEQHIQRLTALKAEFEREYEELEDKHSREKAELQSELDVTLEREQRLRRQMAELSTKLQGSNYETMQHREFELKEQNQELRLVIQKLMDHQAGFALSMEKWNWEQKDMQERRAALLSQCLHLEDSISVKTTNQASTWKSTLDKVHSDITSTLSRIFVGDNISARNSPACPTIEPDGMLCQGSTTATNNNNNSSAKLNVVQDEKKEDPDCDVVPVGIHCSVEPEVACHEDTVVMDKICLSRENDSIVANSVPTGTPNNPILIPSSSSLVPPSVMLTAPDP
jgi:hypothetical protein